MFNSYPSPQPTQLSITKLIVCELITDNIAIISLVPVYNLEKLGVQNLLKHYKDKLTLL